MKLKRHIFIRLLTYCRYRPKSIKQICKYFKEYSYNYLVSILNQLRNMNLMISHGNTRYGMRYKSRPETIEICKEYWKHKYKQLPDLNSNNNKQANLSAIAIKTE